MYLSYYVIGCSSILMLPLVTSRTLPMYVYVPEALGSNFIWALETFTVPLLDLNVFSFDYLTFTFLQLTIMQFQLLNSSINQLKFGKGQDNEKLKMQLAKIIRHHIFLLEFVRTLKQVTSMPLLVQLFNTVSAFCIELYLMRNQ